MCVKVGIGVLCCLFKFEYCIVFDLFVLMGCIDLVNLNFFVYLCIYEDFGY